MNRRSAVLLLTLALVGPLAAGGGACGSEAADEAAPEPAAPQHVRVTDRAGRLGVVLPTGLVVHRFEDAVQATSPDGAFRLYVRRTGAAKLLHLAGPGKDTLVARGWTRNAEQHLERAVHATFQRGGTARAPAERREVWWVARGGETFVCDGVATRGGEALLGDALRDLCSRVELRGDGVERDGAEPDGPDAGSGAPDGG